MHVELRVEARDDLANAAAFYDGQRDELGEYFIDSLFADLERLESEAGIHEIVYGLHRKLSERFPYAIYYRVADPVIDVVAVLDCRRDPDAIKRRLEPTTP
jgi:plasmid stabilization system protein ParE